MRSEGLPARSSVSVGSSSHILIRVAGKARSSGHHQTTGVAKAGDKSPKKEDDARDS